tara:strand:+ start:4165 stop:4680 length:516 start_codon:yes stop_codon:yes gene_type:complete
MANTTFSGPVRSRRGFVTAGPDSVIDITAETTLTFADHAGRLITVNDADGAITLPTIASGSKGASAGDDDPTVNNHFGAVYRFYIETDCSDCDIKTDGTDKFVGSLEVMGDSNASSTFVPGATNDVISMNGTTTGGDKGSYVEVTAVKDNVYLVQGVLVGSGSAATPFADS